MPDFAPDSPYQPKSLGDRLAHARRVLGVALGADIGQSHLARLLGISPSAVSNWEADAKRPNQSIVPRLAASLGVRPGYLMFGELPMGAELPREVAKAWRLLLDASPSGLPIPKSEKAAEEPVIETPKTPSRAAKVELPDVPAPRPSTEKSAEKGRKRA